MEVEDEPVGPVPTTSAEATGGEARSVMAGPSIQPSVSVQLHPLVIMNISDHWTRIRAQNNGQAEQVRDMTVTSICTIQRERILAKRHRFRVR